MLYSVSNEQCLHLPQGLPRVYEKSMRNVHILPKELKCFAGLMRLTQFLKSIIAIFKYITDYKEISKSQEYVVNGGKKPALC